MNVFSPCAGVAVYTQKNCGDGGPQFLSITVGGDNLYDHGIITGISCALTGNYQFLHTVNNFIYLYAFGDRISVLNITGIGFTQKCSGASDKVAINKIYDFYKNQRVAKRKNALGIVVTGTEDVFKFKGYLTGMTIDVKNSEGLGTVGFWNMRFEAVIDD